MSEHLATLNLTAAGVFKFAIPKDGCIKGVYASAAVTIGYEDNGNIGTLKTSVTEWEPAGIGFMPASIAYLVITTTAPTNVAIRYEV